jgi:hypothetical protein
MRAVYTPHAMGIQALRWQNPASDEDFDQGTTSPEPV